MAKGWMEAANQNGIPTAFIVKDGTIQWIGHPMMMEDTLKAVVNGTHDVMAAQKEFRDAALKEAMIEKFMGQLEELKELAETDYKGAVEKAKALDTGGDPQLESPRNMFIMEIYAKHDLDKFKGMAKEMMKGGEDQRMELAFLGFQLAETNKDATRMIADGLSGNKDETSALVLYYCGLGYATIEDFKSAVSVQERCVAAVKAHPELFKDYGDDFLPAMEQALEQYKQKAG
jgi:hypothetical protein